MQKIEAPELGLFSALAPDDHGEPAGAIGIPVRDHLNAATVTALVTTASGGWIGPGRHVDFNIVQGSIVTLQRNELVQRMRGDWLMFIDDDMVWQPPQLRRLIERFEESELDMLGALCFRRSSPFQPTMYMREAPDAGAYNFLEDWPSGEIVEVDATGMAFIVIRKSVFERMVELYEGKPGWTMPPYEVRIQQSPPNFFRWEGQLGEDLRFCQEARKAGCRVWIDTSIEVGHVAEVQIGHRNFLRELADRSETLVAERRAINDSMGFPTVTPKEAARRLRS